MSHPNDANSRWSTCSFKSPVREYYGSKTETDIKKIKDTHCKKIIIATGQNIVCESLVLAVYLVRDDLNKSELQLLL